MFIDIGIRKERIYGEKEFVWEMPHTTLSRQLKTLENEGLIIRRGVSTDSDNLFFVR